MNRHKSKIISCRNIRLADQIQKDLAKLIQGEINVRRTGLITLSSVALSADYAHAKVYFSVIGADPEITITILNSKAGWLHSQLFKLLHVHTIPMLHFFHDPKIEHGIEISQLIDRANHRELYLDCAPHNMLSER